MTTDDYDNAPWQLGRVDSRTTFAQCYASPPANADVASQVAASMLGTLGCIDGNDYLKSILPNAHPYHIETVRALYSQHGDCTAVEFRKDTENRPHRYRRIYNLFLGLVQSGLATFRDIRDNLVYVVVLDSVSRPSGISLDGVAALSAHFDRLVATPRWEYRFEDIPLHSRDERRLSGFLCRKAYLLYKDEIDSFVQSKGWR